MSEKVESTLAILVDVLLPGDRDFPPASAVGTHRLLADRLRSRYGEEKLQDLLELISACSGPQQPLDETAVRRLEREHSAEFTPLRQIAYVSYYESAEVVCAIRALGHDYQAAPQPAGYRLAPFDPAVDAPTHRRGFYKSTADMEKNKP
jgi:hypothetical protein